MPESGRAKPVVDSLEKLPLPLSPIAEVHLGENDGMPPPEENREESAMAKESSFPTCADGFSFPKVHEISSSTKGKGILSPARGE